MGVRTFHIRDFDRSGVVEPDEETYYDHDENGMLDDSERDEDATACRTGPRRAVACSRPIGRRSTRRRRRRCFLSFPGTLLDDEDTDGDGIRDGADDPDHDDIPNVMECSRSLAGNGTRDALDAPAPGADGRLPHGWVNPFAPCLPYAYSRSCERIVTIGEGWAPFNTKPADIYFIHN